MPITLPASGSATNGSPGQAEQAAPPMIPFIRATTRHDEPAFDVTQTITGSTQALGPFDVPAHGFVRSIRIQVEATGGVLSTDTISPDFPWNIIESIELTDTNGFPVLFPTKGYNLYLANLFGGYRGFNDPTQHPDYDSGVTDLNAVFQLRIPVEITPWDAFGALSNQNQSAPFRVRVTLAANTTLATGGALTEPSVRVRGFLEAYSPVPAQSNLGQPQEQAPPGHGATQFWSTNTQNVSSGQSQIRHPRVGNLIRNLIYVYRTSAGVRSATVEPDSQTLSWDSRQVYVNKTDDAIRSDIYETFGLSTVPTGVQVFPFTDDQDGSGGFESRHLWLPTVQTSRLELDASFGAAGTIEIITNDVAVTALGR